jgi:eukaryotic-like serine/threonine-protein kinase
MSEHPREPSPNADEAAVQRAATSIGRVISKRYRIDRVLAMGGMGAVYRGEHVHMHKPVAIKILHPDAERLPELVQRFEREAIAGAHIQHPNVAAATDFGEDEDGSRFLVLEYVRGTTLHELIRRGAVPVQRAVRIGRQLAAALGATHAMNIVHRDVKPRNVMVVESLGDLVKLIDFGLAKVNVERLRFSGSAVESQRGGRVARDPVAEGITTSGVIFGTIAYLAPESAFGMELVDARSDLYALGVILYEMLAGRHPFDARDPIELFNQQRSAPVPPIAERSGVEVPRAVEAIVQRLLEKQPNARFQTADALIAALDEACVALGVAVGDPGDEPSSSTHARVVEELLPSPSTPGLDVGPAESLVLGESSFEVIEEYDSDSRPTPVADLTSLVNALQTELRATVVDDPRAYLGELVRKTHPAPVVEAGTPAREEARPVEASRAREAPSSAEASFEQEEWDAIPEREALAPTEAAPECEALAPAEAAPEREALAPAEAAPEREELISVEASAEGEEPAPAEASAEGEEPAPAEASAEGEEPTPAEASAEGEEPAPAEASAQREAHASNRDEAIRESERRDRGSRQRSFPFGRVARYLAAGLLAAGLVAAFLGRQRAAPEPEPEPLRPPPPIATATTAAVPEPVPPASASAAPDTSASAAAAPADPPADEAARKALFDAANAREWIDAVAAILALAERDPAALRDRKLAMAARNTAIALSKTGGEHADKVFDALANRLGTYGIDVLYEIVENRGLSTSALRAAELLRKPDVASHGSPAARVSFELRDAACGEKLKFVDRAVEDGDDRTLVVLETVVKPCFNKSRVVDDAVRKLRARLSLP